MTAWTADELDRIGAAEELGIASTRPDGSLRSFVTIWVVRAGDELFVRSAYGSDNPWFVRARASGTGRVRAGGIEADVAFEDAANATPADLDAVYREKYGTYPPSIIATVVGPDAAPNTLRLVKRVVDQA